MNTSIASINMSFGRFGTAKDLWEFLSIRYASGDLAQQYQILTSLHHMKQSPGQSVNEFYSQMVFFWNQLALFEPQWQCKNDATLFGTYCNRLRLNQFLMALTDDFEHVRASLLYHKALPFLDVVLSEVISEETRTTLHARQPIPNETVLATAIAPFKYKTQSYLSKQANQTNYSQNTEYKKPVCRYCCQIGHMIQNCPKLAKKIAVVATNESSSISLKLTATDVEAIVNQVLSRASIHSASTASDMSRNTIWLLDSAYSNQMKSDSSKFPFKTPTSNIPKVHTANRSTLQVILAQFLLQI